MPGSARPRVTVGRITGIFGVRGWVRVFSYTDPPEKILEYGPWLVGDDEVTFEVAAGDAHGRGVIAHLESVDDREAARLLIGREIRVPREQFAAPAANEYYWTDLVGLQVIGADGRRLGEVVELLETGANDVLVLRGERRRLIPFIPGRVVKSVDLPAGVISVDWDADF